MPKPPSLNYDFMRSSTSFAQTSNQGAARLHQRNRPYSDTTTNYNMHRQPSSSAIARAGYSVVDSYACGSNYDSRSHRMESVSSVYPSFDSACSKVRHGRYGDLKKLFNSGLPPNYTDQQGNTLLMVAAQNN